MTIEFIRDDGKSFLLGGSYADSAKWGILSISGIGEISSEISTEKNATGDGDIITGFRIPSRSIDITALVKSKSNNVAERSTALSFFNPKHSFKMFVTRNGITRWIVALVERFKCPDQNVSKNVQMDVALKCVDPYFYSKDDFGKNIAAVKTTFGFPFISPVGKGFNVGIYNFNRAIGVDNTGDVETYFSIRMEAFGDVVNPKVIKDNAYIRLIDTLRKDDVVQVNLVDNTIRKNGDNCIGKVDRTSSFSGMRLDVGDNTVSFAADDGDTNMRVLLYYNLRYLGA